mmetsp:Transcript_1642/g.3080  ORF Transcript_1642/g.3080 Transcript_1642/m.3080 type:complete len:312 (+) Transcript_1642:3-938(+)
MSTKVASSSSCFTTHLLLIEIILVFQIAVHIPIIPHPLRRNATRIAQLEVLGLLIDFKVRITKQPPESIVLHQRLGHLPGLGPIRRLCTETVREVRIDLLPGRRRIGPGSDPRGALFFHPLLDFLGSVFVVFERLGHGADAIVETDVDEESVHVPAQQGRADEVLDAQCIDLGAGEEFVILVDCFGRNAARVVPGCGRGGFVEHAVLLFQFLRDVVEERAPLGRGAEDGAVEGLDFGLLSRAEQETVALAAGIGRVSRGDEMREVRGPFHVCHDGSQRTAQPLAAWIVVSKAAILVPVIIATLLQHGARRR